MTETYIYIAIAFVAGFAIAWVVQMFAIGKIKKLHKSAGGFLESERLKRENLQKENMHVYSSKQILEMEMQKKIDEATQLNRLMDSDILLLQKSNEETEAMLLKAEPALHALKLKLIEANNTIARYKAQLGIKD